MNTLKFTEEELKLFEKMPSSVKNIVVDCDNKMTTIRKDTERMNADIEKRYQ